MFKRFFIVLFAFYIFSVPAFASGPPDIDVKSAILTDASTGQILYEKNMNEIMHPASITKIISVYLSVVNSSPDEQLTVSLSDTQLIDDATNINLSSGEIVTMRDMQYTSMVRSANDSANVIASGISGSTEEFAKLMNEFAQSVGAVNTNFTNPHGLPEDTHLTTAYDMALMTSEAIKNPEFAEIFGTVEYTMPATNYSGERQIAAVDAMINPEAEEYYEYITGGKTGWTTPSGFTKVTVATKGGRTLIAVVLYGEELEDIYTSTQTLLDYGFDNYYGMSMSVADFTPIVAETDNGGTVVFRAVRGLNYLLHNDASADDIEFKAMIPDTVPSEGIHTTPYMLSVTIPNAVGEYTHEFSIPMHADYSPPPPVVQTESSPDIFDFSPSVFIIAAVVIILIIGIAKNIRK